jgi:pectin methylesterase-like acyl-CoA thioesterase
VAADGSGNFVTLNAGLQSLSSSGGSLYIKPGTYKEAAIITAPNIALYGLGGDPSKIVLTDDLSNGPNNLNGALGDKGSATVQVLGDGFYADNITFQNTFDLENNQDTTPNAQALAVWVTGDRAIFNNGRFIGRQDTVFGGSKGCTSTTCLAARQYFFQAYVEGNVDYIFGDGATVFESSTIHSLYHSTASGEATITAQNKRFTGAGSYLSGEVFSNCILTAENDNGQMTNLYLGRPWGTYSTNVYLNTNMQAPIKGAGWIEFTPGTTNNLPTSFYAEYNSTGPGALGPRESFAVQLTAATAAPWQPLTFLAGTDGWNPQTTLAQRAAAVVPSAQSLTVPQGSGFTLISRIAPAVGGAPTGTVQFFDGGNLLITVNVDASLEASFSTSSLPVGAHSITIQYSGDANFIASTSSPVNITITPASTNLALTLSSSTPTYGDVVAATASVTSSGAGTPSGTVTFSIDGNALPPVALTNNSASLPLPLAALSAGPHSVTAAYSGDTNFTAATANVDTLSVAQAATTVSLGSSAVSSAFGAATTFTANVTPASAGMPTGTAQFFDGENSLATVPIDATGRASFSTSSLPVGAHSITVQYSGDTNFTSSTSSPASIIITPGVTSLTLTLSSSTAVYGSPITATATISFVAPATPTGTIMFSVDGTGSSPVAVAQGTASLPLAVLNAGIHTITAAYSGDINFTASTANSVTLNITQASTAVSLISSASSTVLGSSVTFTASVTPSSGSGPTGVVQFMLGARAFGSPVPLSGGAATLTTSALPSGTDSVTAVYSGDTNFTGSTSSPVTVIVLIPSVITLASSPSGPAVSRGTNISFNAAVAGGSPASPVPTGTVTFFDGATPLGSQVAINGGSATFATGALALGPHSVTAQYSGDANYTAGTSSPVGVTITPALTSLALTVSSSTPVFGAPVTATVNISSAAPGTPIGTVTFSVDGAAFPAVAVANSSASLLLPTLGAGPHTITAAYSGDPSFAPSTAGAITLNVSRASATVALASSTSSAVFNTPVSFTASVTPSSGSGLAGSVTFFDGATPISPAITLSGNTGTFSTSTLALGTHNITAQYSGDANYTGALSAPSAVTIVVPPDFTIALGSTTLRFDDERTPPDAVTLTPIGAYSGTISFSCSGLPRNTICVFNPPSSTLTNSKSQTVFLRIRTAKDDRDGRNDRDGRDDPEHKSDDKQGKHNFTVTATDGIISHAVTVTLIVEE